MERFSVAALAPFRRGVGALRLGLGRLDARDWLDTGMGLAARRAAKPAVFDAAPESLIVLPEAAEAVAELAAQVGAAAPTLRAAAEQTFEDLLILLPRGDGHVLFAGALAFPTDWHLQLKIGKALPAIHAPIPTYADKLSAGVGHVFTHLAPQQMLTRAKWNVLETDRLRYLPDVAAMQRFGHVTASNAGETLFVPVERQTLRRLPISDTAVFGIGGYIEPLGALPAALDADLAAAVQSVPPEEAIRRGTPAYRDALAEYARVRTA